MKSATMTWDPDVHALYVQVVEAEVAETVELAKGVYPDVDTAGQATGIEILNADASLLVSIPALSDKAALRDLIDTHAA